MLSLFFQVGKGAGTFWVSCIGRDSNSLAVSQGWNHWTPLAEAKAFGITLA